MSSLIGYTFFRKRPKLGPYQLYPLTAGRLIVLEQRGNPLAGAGSEEDPDPFALYEALLVSSSDPAALAELSLLEDDDWKREVRTFGFELEDEILGQFQQVIETEMEEIQKSMTQPKKKAAKKGRPARVKK